MKRRLATAALLTLIALGSTPAIAQQAQPSLSDRETARSLMEDGDAKRDKGDWRGALKSYEAADAIMHVPTTGYEVGRAQAQLGLLLEARETLGRVLRIPSRVNEPAPFVQARKNADALNADLATRIPSVQIVLRGADPARAPQVTVDGEPIPAAAVQAPRKVNPGAHVIVVRSGALEKKQDVTVSEREAKQVPIELKEPPLASADAPAPPPSDANGGGSTGAKVLMFGGFGVGLVGLGVGSVTGLMHLSKTSDIKDQCSGNDCPPRVKADLDSATTLGDIATAAFIVGGAGVAAGIVGLILSSSGGEAKAEKSAAIRPILSPSYAGVAGSF